MPLQPREPIRPDRDILDAVSTFHVHFGSALTNRMNNDSLTVVGRMGSAAAVCASPHSCVRAVYLSSSRRRWPEVLYSRQIKYGCSLAIWTKCVVCGACLGNSMEHCVAASAVGRTPCSRQPAMKCTYTIIYNIVIVYCTLAHMATDTYLGCGHVR